MKADCAGPKHIHTGETAMNRRIFLSTATLVTVSAIVAYFAQFPSAATPFGVVVQAVLQPHSSFTTVGASSGAYKVLPSGLPSGGVLLLFYAPSPSELEIDIDGDPLPNLAHVPAGTDTTVTGYFRVQDVNRNQNPAIWTVGVRPPNSKLASSALDIHVVDVSWNRFATPANRRSAPMTVKLVAQNRYQIAVTLTGDGQGFVTSTPAGIYCPPVCFFDYGLAATTVTLTPNPSSNSTFAGWSGPCSGYQNCQVTLNGTSLAPIAAFRATGDSNTNISPCPPIDPPPGYSWFAKPYCPGQNVFNDPSPDLSCNAQKYFCCAKVSGGGGGGLCGPGHSEFPPSCDFNNVNIRQTPSGCYEKN